MARRVVRVPSASRSLPPRKRRGCGVCGWVIEDDDRRAQVPAHLGHRHNKCSGAGVAPTKAIVPGWVEPGGYEPAYGGGGTGRKPKAKARAKPDPTPTPASPRAAAARPTRPRPVLDPSPRRTVQSATAEAPALFSRILKRGLQILNDGGAERRVATLRAEILDVPIQIAFVEAVDANSARWSKRCVRPPFAAQWLEYECSDLFCGALIEETGEDAYQIRFVTTPRAGRGTPVVWPGPEYVTVAGDGAVEHRRSAVSDPRNDVAGTALGRPRRAPVEHPVRGHQRRLASGDVVWVRAHERGTGGTGPSLPRVYRVSRR